MKTLLNNLLKDKLKFSNKKNISNFCFIKEKILKFERKFLNFKEITQI